MAGARFLAAQTCPWTQGLHKSRLFSTPRTRGFRLGVVLLLDWLPTKAAKPKVHKDAWFAQKKTFLFHRRARGGPNFEAYVRRLNPSVPRPLDVTLQSELCDRYSMVPQ